MVPKGRNAQPTSPVGQGRVRSLQRWAAIKRRLRLRDARDKKREVYLANLTLINLSHLFSLDLCKLVFMSIPGIYFPLLKNCDSGHIPSYSAQCNLGSLLVNIFCQQPARKHKLSADKICRCCRVQGVVNNDQNRTLFWVFSKIENMQTVCI